MSDFYLRASSEQALYSALEAAGVIGGELTDKGMVRGVLPGYALDVIGTITQRIGGTDESPIMQTLDGFHANLRGNPSGDQQALLPLIPKPAAPARVWA